MVKLHVFQSVAVTNKNNATTVAIQRIPIELFLGWDFLLDLHLKSHFIREGYGSDA